MILAKAQWIPRLASQIALKPASDAFYFCSVLVGEILATGGKLAGNNQEARRPLSWRSMGLAMDTIMPSRLTGHTAMPLIVVADVLCTPLNFACLFVCFF